MGGDGSSFQPELLGAMQHFRNADGRGRTESMPQLLGVDRLPVKAQEHDQLGEAGIPFGLFIHRRKNPNGLPSRSLPAAS